MSSVLITGAGKGFGLELLKVYAGKNWTIFPLIRNKKTAEDLADKYAPYCYPIVGDVTSDSIGEQIRAVLQKNTDSLDILINNAGNICKNFGLEKTSPDDFIDLFDVHCVGALRCIKAARPCLKKASKPVIINISSRWGSIGMTSAGQAGIRGIIYSYKIAKAAQNMLTACLSEELKSEGIKVFAIHPGRLKTTVAAPDADVDPHDAAEKLYTWIEQTDDKRDCRLYDLMNDTAIDW